MESWPVSRVVGLQRRLESQPAGQAVISAFVAFTVLAVVVVNMPSSALRDDLQRLTGRYVQAVGLDQNWAIFSDPRTLTAYVDAQVDFTDGSSLTMPIPPARGLGEFVDYRWQKYEEMVRTDDHRDFWPVYARYVARRSSSDGRTPLRVTLSRRFSESRPPGPGPDRVPFRRYVFFTYDVPAS